MKILIALTLALSASSAFAQEGTMAAVAKALMNFDKLSKDYSRQKIEKINIRGTKFQTRLNVLTRRAVKKWEKLLDSEEYADLSPEKRRLALEKPATYLGVTYLIEIQEVEAIYYRGELIGYKVDTADHVQAAIYQDGAGIHFYLDVDMKVVAEDEWSA